MKCYKSFVDKLRYATPTTLLGSHPLRDDSSRLKRGWTMIRQRMISVPYIPRRLLECTYIVGLFYSYSDITSHSDDRLTLKSKRSFISFIRKRKQRFYLEI